MPRGTVPKKKEVLEMLEVQRREFLREYAAVQHRARMLEEHATSAERRLKHLEGAKTTTQTVGEDLPQAKIQRLLKQNEDLNSNYFKLQNELLAASKALLARAERIVELEGVLNRFNHLEQSLKTQHQRDEQCIKSLRDYIQALEATGF